MKPYTEKIITGVLKPLSRIYGFGVWVRNKLYDSGIKKETEFDVPVVSVGNLTVGGTGKTPHVEYIAKKLSNIYNIVVLSRGYKRRTKGFVVANSKSSPLQIGDEPMQIYNNLRDKVKVVVCENRKYAIERIMKLYPETSLIILDDAYQHRTVKPKVSILLVDYNRPIEKDDLLPLGRLREPAHAKYRADMIIVTKCPDFMNPLDYSLISKDLDLLSFQQLFFSSYEYGELKPVFSDEKSYSVHLSALNEDDAVLLITGIAYPRMFVNHFRRYPFNVRILRFPDHHDFSKKDIKSIYDYFGNMDGKRKIILTTEKDAVRLEYNPYFPDELKPLTFYLPIDVRMRHGIDGKDLMEELTKAIENKFTT